MKAGISLRCSRASDAKTARVWFLSIAFTLLLLSVWVWTIFQSGPSVTAGPRPVAAGQLQADMRTIAAAFQYLCDADSSLISPVATSSASGSIVLQPLGSRLEGSDYPSNQSEFPFEQATNRPARS